jgi:hypothetical protein
VTKAFSSAFNNPTKSLSSVSPEGIEMATSRLSLT